MFPLAEMQKQYGKKIDPKIVMRGWEIKLARRFTVEQILYAVDKYTDVNDDFPTPANIINILNPKKPEITQAEYIAATAWQKQNNNYSPYTQEGMIISEYKKQRENIKDDYQKDCNTIKLLANKGVDLIECG